VSKLLLVNPRATSASGKDDLVAAAEALGVEVHVLADGEDLGELARASNADVLGVAGGDGSLGAVAAVCVERDVPFVCVPFGNRNHFARDLGLDRDDPVAALAAFDGIERRVDVGRANDCVFLNNVSFGAYAVLVHHGWRRAVDALRLRHRFRVDGETVRTRVLLVGNNAYSLTGARERLDEGVLHLYTPGGEIRTATHVSVAGHAAARAGIDGEPTTLTPPVELSIEPRGLRVLTPSGPGA
jgi:diacylglycerol kinase family enzyme